MSQSLNMTSFFDGLRATFRGLRLSLVEIVFLAAAILFAVLVVAFYLTKITPRRLELSSLQGRETRAQVTLNQQVKREKELEMQRKNAQEILDSLKDFEVRLKDKIEGYPQIIDAFDQMAKANHVPGSGVTFRTIEPDPATDSSNPAPPAARHDKELSVYPALGLDTTVEGNYHDLRGFISDLERSKQFIIINAITLQSVDEKARRSLKGAPLVPGPGPVQMQRPAARTVPTVPDAPTTVTVSLKIETDTYFQKRITP